MKKLLCLLLIFVFCFTLFACTEPETPPVNNNNGGETDDNQNNGNNDQNNQTPEKTPMTAEKFAELVNAGFADINKGELPGTAGDTDQIIDELMTLVNKLQGSLVVYDGDQITDDAQIISLKDGVVSLTYRSQDPDSNDDDYIVYVTYTENGLVQVYEENSVVTQVSVMPFAQMFAPGGSVDLPFDPAELTLTLPEMTADDLLVQGEDFTIRNDYLAKVLSAAIDALPAEAMDPSEAAQIKTILPGMLQNLGLTATVMTKDGAATGMSLSFDANKDFFTLLEMPTDMVLKGHIKMTSEGADGPVVLDLQLQVGDYLKGSAKVTVPENLKPTAELDLTIFNPNGSVGHGYWDEFGNEIIHTISYASTTTLKGKLDATHLGEEAGNDYQLISFDFKQEYSDVTLYTNGVQQTITGENEYLVERYMTADTLSIRSQRMNGTMDRITATMDGDNYYLDIDLTDVTEHKPLPADAKTAIDDAFALESVAADIYAVIEEENYGEYAFVTPKGLLLIRYYGNDGDYYFEPGTTEIPEYYYVVIYEGGKYIITYDEPDDYYPDYEEPKDDTVNDPF